MPHGCNMHTQTVLFHSSRDFFFVWFLQRHHNTMSATQLADSLQVKSQTHNNSKKGPLMCSNGISKTNILHPIAGSYPSWWKLEYWNKARENMESRWGEMPSRRRQVHLFQGVLFIITLLPECITVQGWDWGYLNCAHARGTVNLWKLGLHSLIYCDSGRFTVGRRKKET